MIKKFLDYVNKIELDNKKISLIIIFGILALYIDFTFIVRLQMQGIKLVTPKIIKLKTDIGILSKDLASMQDLKAKYAQKKEGFLLAKKIISEDKIPALLQSISDIANNNNVKITKILPSRESKDKTAIKVKTYLITLDLSCDYHRFGKFINDLENAAQLMAVQDIKMTRDANDYLRQNVNLVLKAYVKK